MDRQVLITGGSRGIGRACVEAFRAAGDRVAFLYRTQDTIADEVMASTGAYGIRADIADPGQVRRVVAKATEWLGGVDVLVNNAGVSVIGLIQDMSDADWRRLIDTDLSGAFYLCREITPLMVSQHRGAIINIGSMWGRAGASCEVAYSAAKAGIRGLTLSLAKELGPSGITVNCVEPGVIETDMNASLDRTTLQTLCEETPLGRVGTPQEVADAVLYLARASFITGQVLGVDGGYGM